MLFESERHEQLDASGWDESAARKAIERIVVDTTGSFSVDRLWPVHSLDWPGATEPFRMLYIGAAGVMWGLEYLHRVGAAASPPDFIDAWSGLLEANRAVIGGLNQGTGSLLMGDTGILLLHCIWSSSPELEAGIAKAISANVDHPARELMWGSPGTMLAALVMYERTGNESWAELFRQGAAAIQAKLESDDEFGCSLWTQELYGHRSRLIGAVHGFAGNVFPLIRGRQLLTEAEWSQWSNRVVETMTATALREDGLANWPQSIGEPRPGRTSLLVQHCHGAPGVVNCLADLLDDEMDQLLVDAGELTWKAGPLEKGAGLCHGTAGNGYAFLKLFQRTRDSLWLDRARRFAMHAIQQSERHHDEYGQRRYSLWTGDQGLAIYLWSCIQANAEFPTMDVF